VIEQRPLAPALVGLMTIAGKPFLGSLDTLSRHSSC
jgi:hypothetical protein